VVRESAAASAKAASRRGARRRRSWLPVLKLLVFPVVAGLFLLLYLDVEVTRRFEGRIFTVPTRIYSDRLRIHPGDPLGPDAVLRRLGRSGYAAVAGTPSRPGEYRKAGGRVEAYLRGFALPGGEIKARRAVIRFDGALVASVSDASGRSQNRVELEPELLATIFGPQHVERQMIALDDVPDGFLAALLAAEDVRFFDHHGVDPVAIARASLKNVRAGRIVQGGSTLTQQLVKNLYLDQRKTFFRKGREAILATLLELRYPKPRILEAYLNHVYLGQRGPVAICGVSAGARFYFGRDLKDLTQAEWAMLAGIIRNPGGYNPFLHAERALERRNLVLDAMVRVGSLKRQDADRSREEPLRLGSGEGGFDHAPYVADFVRSQLAELYSIQMLEEGGLRVYTSIDTLLQENAETSLAKGIEQLEASVPSIKKNLGKRRLQGLLLATEPRTGEVLAMVGGRDYKSSQFNRTVQARRQPGSCFKPFVYLAGFEAAIAGRDGALNPATILDDQPLDLVSGGKAWHPENYDGQFRGPVTARHALEESLNVPTVRAAQQVGLKDVVEIARRCGLPGELRPFPSLALGAQEVSPLELATAYGTLAAEGMRVSPSIIRAVVGADGEAISRHRQDPVRAVSPQGAYLVTDVLRGVLLRGTGASAGALGFYGDAAGKTGTTDDMRDAWFVGYTPDLLALTWVGYDSNEKTGLTGASGALPIWVNFMMRSKTRWGSRGFVEPSGIVRVEIDPETGERATRKCPARFEESFAEGAEPAEDCHLHGSGVFKWFKRLWNKDQARVKPAV